MADNYRERDRSPIPTYIDDNENYEELPKEFFCPISKKIITDPARFSDSHITYDRDSIKDLYEQEVVLPDLRMRNIMEERFSHYDVDPLFKFISNQVDLMEAAKSVAQQLNVDLLREFRDAIECEPWLMDNGGNMRCVTTLLSFQQENLPPNWVPIVLSIVSYSDEILEVPAGIHPEYSLLRPISKTCASHLRATKNVKFQRGLINLMHGLVINSPDISAMAGKLGGIIQALVLYIWPVRECFIEKQCYIMLLSTLERLSENDEICEGMVDVGIIGMLFILLDFGISSSQELIDDRYKETALLALGPNYEEDAQLMVIETVLKILCRLCSHSERARERMQQITEEEYNTLMICQSRCM